MITVTEGIEEVENFHYKAGIIRNSYRMEIKEEGNEEKCRESARNQQFSC